MSIKYFQKRDTLDKCPTYPTFCRLQTYKKYYGIKLLSLYLTKHFYFLKINNNYCIVNNIAYTILFHLGILHIIKYPNYI